MDFKDVNVLDEARPTKVYDIMREIKKIPSFKQIVDMHFLADGMAAFFRSDDGNAYEIIIHPANFAQHFKKQRGVE